MHVRCLILLLFFLKVNLSQALKAFQVVLNESLKGGRGREHLVLKGRAKGVIFFAHDNKPGEDIGRKKYRQDRSRQCP